VVSYLRDAHHCALSSPPRGKGKNASSLSVSLRLTPSTHTNANTLRPAQRHSDGSQCSLRREEDTTYNISPYLPLATPSLPPSPPSHTHTNTQRSTHGHSNSSQCSFRREGDHKAPPPSHPTKHTETFVRSCLLLLNVAFGEEKVIELHLSLSLCLTPPPPSLTQTLHYLETYVRSFFLLPMHLHHSLSLCPPPPPPPPKKKNPSPPLHTHTHSAMPHRRRLGL